MSNSSSVVRSKSSNRLLVAQLAALLVAALIVAVGEIPRFRGAIESGFVFGWFADMNLDTTPYCLLLLVLPVCWIARRSLLRVRAGWIARSTRCSSENGPQAETIGLREWLLATLVGFVSLGTSLWVSQRPLIGVDNLTFGDLPPAYHDEFSYLFQAETFRAGRLAFESHPDAPELFDQMHVLNDDGRFASRFFPGTGVWMLPFVALDRPYWGHWLAGALSAFFIFLGGPGIGREWSGVIGWDADGCLPRHGVVQQPAVGPSADARRVDAVSVRFSTDDAITALGLGAGRRPGAVLCHALSTDDGRRFWFAIRVVVCVVVVPG